MYLREGFSTTNKVSYKSNSKTHFTTAEKRGALGLTLDEHKSIHTNKKQNEGFPFAADNF